MTISSLNITWERSIRMLGVFLCLKLNKYNKLLFSKNTRKQNIYILNWKYKVICKLTVFRVYCIANTSDSSIYLRLLLPRYECRIIQPVFVLYALMFFCCFDFYIALNYLSRTFSFLVYILFTCYIVMYLFCTLKVYFYQWKCVYCIASRNDNDKTNV